VSLSITYGVIIGLVQIFFGRSLTLLIVGAEETVILDAAGRMLAANGALFWVLSILNVCRPTVQSLGHTSRAMFAGVLEMIARTVVCTVFVPVYGFNVICIADPIAWIAATTFIVIVVKQDIDAAVRRSDERLAPYYRKIGVAMPR
jgi:Na+-driven multidrug efflux pump